MRRGAACSDMDARGLARAEARLGELEQHVAAGTWRLTPETLTVILRHTLGIVAALQATVVSTAAVSS